MFLVTNREIRRERSDATIPGKRPNVNGPNELRLPEAQERAGRWTLTVLPDK